MKNNVFTLLSVYSLVGGVSTSHGQVTSAEFFDPDFSVSPTAPVIGIGASSIDSDSDNLGSGNLDWTHTAQGHTWANLGASNIHLAAFTETIGDSLVFGRRQTAAVVGISFGDLVSELTTAGLVNAWASTATVTQTLTAGQEYSLEFLVTSPALVSADLLGSASLGISGGTFTEPGGAALLPIDLLGLADVDVLSSSATASVSFVPASTISEFSVNFAATSLVGLDVLGGAASQQDVLTFSNFSITPIPEPSAGVLLSLGALSLLRRRRRDSAFSS
ncbi:MAG: PEP-CTERM sorting domain-containing protein [Verrucomicrobiota bacterium JB023]|nr:PEP-CTERM sorting domain-containing protein [Verrucomicrobiota bacterium JB023]